MTPRDYQIEMHQRTESALESNRKQLVIAPTGTGKTVFLSMVCKTWGEGRVMIVEPTVELVDQTVEKITAITGIEPTVEQASRRSNESWWARAPFVVATKDTLCSVEKWVDKHGVNQSRRRFEKFKEVRLVIIDEAHYAPAAGYRRIIKHFFDQGAAVLGVTATPDENTVKTFGGNIAYTMTIKDGIDGGWLVSPRVTCPQVKSLDLSDVSRSRSTGDLNAKELAAKLESDKVVHEIASITARESKGLQTVVYCESVDQARQVAHLLVDQHGIKADWVSGKCTKSRRATVLRQFTEDDDGLQIVTNCGVLTTGWDYPALAHLVIARPTQSLKLYQQIMGRGARPLPGVVDFEGSTPESRLAAIAASAKPFYKVTDLRDNSLHHKLITAVDLMGGHLAETVRDLAREIVARDSDRGEEARPIAEIIAEAEARQREIEERDRRRLAARESEVDYHRLKVDPFSESQRGRIHDASPTVKPIKFGKYAGTPMGEVPGEYLEWVLYKSQLPWACKGPCKHELKRRGALRGQPRQRDAAAVAARLRAMLSEV